MTRSPNFSEHFHFAKSQFNKDSCRTLSSSPPLRMSLSVISLLSTALWSSRLSIAPLISSRESPIQLWLKHVFVLHLPIMAGSFYEKPVVDEKHRMDWPTLHSLSWRQCRFVGVCAQSSLVNHGSPLNTWRHQTLVFGFNGRFWRLAGISAHISTWSVS